MLCTFLYQYCVYLTAGDDNADGAGVREHILVENVLLRCLIVKHDRRSEKVGQI